MSQTLADALTEAFGLYERKRLDDARALLLAVVEQAPSPVPSALMLLGEIAAAEDHPDEAAEWLAAAGEAAPADPRPLIGLASLALARGAPEDAEDLLRRALERDPASAPALTGLGVALARRDRPQEAEAALRAAMAADPKAAAPHLHLGTLKLGTGDAAAAEACLRRALRLAPDDPDVALALALALRAQGDAAEAVPMAERAVAARPDGATLTALGELLLEASRPTEAETAFARALEAAPDHAPAHEGIARCRLAALDPAGAARSYRRALALAPEAWPLSVGLGIAARAAGRLEDARVAFAEAPSGAAEGQSALTDLLEGRLAEGWERLERAWRCGNIQFSPLDPPGPRWDGNRIDGTLLVDCGLDIASALMLARFLPTARERVGRLVVVCPEPLRRLLAAMPEVDHAVSRGEVPGGYDIHAAIEVLPALVGASGPPPQPPVPVPRGAWTRWQTVLAEAGPADRPRVGVWRRGSVHALGPAASLPAECAAAVAARTGAVVLDLDAEAPSAGCRALSGFTDLADLAGLLAQLDILVAADGPALRLAAALNVPCLACIPPVGDWAWGLADTASPWLPSIRLHRLEGPDWTRYADRLAAETSALLAAAGTT